MRSGHSASTTRPYDPADAIGDTLPTTAKPPKQGNKCAVFGQLFLAVIAVAVGSLLGGPLGTALGSKVGGAVAAAAIASTVSQGVGLATGIQKQFSFKSVALSALTAGLSQGALGNLSVFSGSTTAATIGNAVVRGAAGSAISQSASMALGLQSRFSWAGVAAAGVAAGVGARLGGGIETRAASLLASAATRSALEGSSFARNIAAGLPDVLAQTIVDVGMGVVRGGGRTAHGGVRELADEATRGWSSKSSNAALQSLGGINPDYLSNEALAAALEFDYERGLASVTAGLPTLPADILLELAQADAHSSIRARARMEREARAAGDDIIVTARSNPARRTATTITVGDVVGGPISPAADWDQRIRSDAGSSDFIPYLRRNRYIGSAALNLAFANDLIERSSYWPLRRLALPALRTANESDAALLPIVQRLDAHFAGVDAVARNQLDRPLGYFILGSATAAVGLIAAPAAAAWGGSFYISGSTASVVAAGGAGALTGGAFGAGIEYSLNEFTGTEHTASGYTAAAVGGAVGGTGLRLLRGAVGRAAGERGQMMALGAFSGFTGNFSGQFVESGIYNINYGQLGLASMLGGAFGAATPLEVRINGVTSGRSPLSQYQGLQTRMNSGDIARMRLRYPVTAGAANAVVGSGQQAAGAAVDRVRQRAGN